MRNTLSFLASIFFVSLLQSTVSYGMECGDHDGSGSVGASDALIVLRKSVGLPADLLCPDTSCNPTTTTFTPTSSSLFVDECFDDADCEGFPGEPHCCSYECAECDKNEHCGEGEYCSSGCECLPLP